MLKASSLPLSLVIFCLFHFAWVSERVLREWCVLCSRCVCGVFNLVLVFMFIIMEKRPLIYPHCNYISFYFSLFLLLFLFVFLLFILNNPFVFSYFSCCFLFSCIAQLMVNFLCGLFFVFLFHLCVSSLSLPLSQHFLPSFFSLSFTFFVIVF